MTVDDTATIDDPMLDEEWLAAPARRSRLRLVLAALLVGSLCFLGGTLVQKQFGTASAEDGSAGLPGGGQAPGGGQLPDFGQGGGFPQGGQLPEGIAGASDDSGDSGDTSDDSGADDSAAVIGEVVEVRGEVWIVEDLGGKRHRITVVADTDVTRETSIKPSQVKVGDPVDITGTTSDGQIEADEVTLR